MFTVTFRNQYKSIPEGFTFELPESGSVKINGETFNLDIINSLLELNLVSISAPEFDEVVLDEPVEHLLVDSSEAWDKISTSVGEDMCNDKFAYGNEYKFYDIENREWKVSKLKKTASHIGRVMGGFAVPVDATARKMFNRLEKLNSIYNLGLCRSDCREITNYYN